MRATIAAAAVLAATPAWAGGITESLAPTSVTAVQLQAGHDYAVEVDGPDGAFVDLVEPNGHVLIRVNAQDTPDEGAEFRAPVGGTWHIRGFGVGANLEPDCQASVRTRCTLASNHTHAASFAWSSDGDWSRVSLRAGQTYTWTYHGTVDGLLVLHDARGRQVAREDDGQDTTLTFRAPNAGTYYIEAFNMDLDFPGTYTIAMH